jgi:O-acetylhomoserine/O-acetylserine sulfhydrylase-like pyridoxal-dependent enzyme
MRHKRDALVGIADGPVHISVGIEEVEGVIADVEQALG